MPDPKEYTVGWICSITTEYVAAQAFLDEEHEGPEYLPSRSKNDYTLGRIGRHNVVISVVPFGSYGNSSAARVAEDMLHSFPNVRIDLIVGVGGGAPSLNHDIRLGDIVVSIPFNGRGGVVQYDFGKTIRGQSFQPTGFLDQPPTFLRAAVNGLRARYEREGHRLKEAVNKALEHKPRLRQKYKRPELESDRLYRSHVVHPPENMSTCATDCGDDLASLVSRNPRSEDEDNPAIHYGLIASANQLMKDALIRDKLAAENGVLCFEMEAAGLINHLPCLVIRGICDYSDSHENKQWQGYAAMVAAAYARDLLCRIAPQQVEREERILEMLRPRIDHVAETTDRVDDKLLILEELQDCLGQTKIKHLPRIDQLPESAEPAYEETLQRCNRRNERDGKRLLHIIGAAKRPLRLSEVDVALGPQLNPKSCGDLDLEGTAESKQWICDARGLFLEKSIMPTWDISFRHLQHFQHIRQPAWDLFPLISIFRAPEALKKMLSTGRPYVLRGMSNPAPTYQNRGRQKGARTQEVLKGVLGAEHLQSLINMSNLVSKYWKQGRLEDAETLQVQVLKTCKRSFSEEHPNTLRSMSTLVSIYQNRGRWDDAEVLGVQMLETLMRLLGVKHLYTLSSMSNLAIAYQNRGRWKSAEALGVQVLETLMGSLGAEHPYTLRSMGNLASIYQSQSRFEDAETLQVLRKRLGNSDMLLPKQGSLLDPTFPSSRCSEASSSPVSVSSLGSAYRSDWRDLGKANIYCKLKGLLYRVGLWESSIPPHHQRFKWTNRHGKTLYDDYIEHKPGALQALRQYLEATTLPMKASSASNQSPTSSQAASIYTQNPIPTSARISTSSNAADQSANRPNNVQIASAQQDIEMGDPSTRRTLLLLCCIERRGRPVRLHQELVTHITDDRELFSTLRRIYYNHRGKIETLWSLRTLHSIHFMKFGYRGHGIIDVRCHPEPCDPGKCACIPPADRVFPQGEDYACQPIPSALLPPIGPRLMMQLFKDPDSLISGADSFLQQLPKKMSGELHSDGMEMKVAWGIFYREDWDWMRIWVALGVAFFPPSLLFGILWGIMRQDIQGAFGVASWWMTGATIAVGIVGTCT